MRIVLESTDSGYRPELVVSDPNPVIEKTGMFSEGGVFSETIFGKMPSTGREYSCDCGLKTRRRDDGITCLGCGTVVRCRDTSFSKRGWIELGEDNYIIALPYYVHFAKVIGPSVLAKILQQKRVLDANGKLKEIGDDEVKGKSPYDGIGLIKFKEKWEEILEYYERKKKTDLPVVEACELLRANATRLFTNKVQVYNHTLRPALVFGKKIVYDEVNNIFNMIISNTSILSEYCREERTEENINSVLYRIQVLTKEVMDNVLNVLAGKGGYLRSDMLGARVNFSARNVITPLGAGYRQNEIVLPYLTLLELYKFQLLNIVSKMQGVSIAKADAMWHKAQTHKDPVFAAAIQSLIDNSDGGLPVLINRNPTISFGSILQMRIVGMKDDYYDFTMSIHNGILKFLAGDYDGDVLSIIPLMDRLFCKAFEVFDPRLMMVSRDGPFMNPAALMDKDHVLGLSILTEPAGMAPIR